MNSVRTKRESIAAYQSMQGLVEVYEEMAAQKMRQIREAILAGREYYRSIATLSVEVGADLSQISKNQHNVALVLLLSESGMYGEIMEKVFALFSQELAREKRVVDVFVAGKTGIEWMRMFLPQIKYTALRLDENLTENQMWGELAKILVTYREVRVCFGEFESLVNQKAVVRQLSAGELTLTQGKWAEETKIKLKFLYEPNAPEVGKIFAEQIFGGMILAAGKENELAKNASRLMHLDSAWTNIMKKLTSEEAGLRKLSKKIRGKKQTISLAGYRHQSRRRV